MFCFRLSLRRCIIYIHSFVCFTAIPTAIPTRTRPVPKSRESPSPNSTRWNASFFKASIFASLLMSLRMNRGSTFSAVLCMRRNASYRDGMTCPVLASGPWLPQWSLQNVGNTLTPVGQDVFATRALTRHRTLRNGLGHRHRRHRTRTHSRSPFPSKQSRTCLTFNLSSSSNSKL